jgi:GAF domain-containing protein
MDLTDWPIASGWVTGRAVLARQVVHVHDLQAAAEEFPDGAEMALRMGHRTTLAIPLMREGEAIGAILIRRSEVRPFSDKQIELVETFAAQAVIAIENARLLNELRQSLEQQTATADVLRVISSSPGELGQVFDAVLDSARRLCEANFGILYRYEADAFHAIALRGAPPAFAEFQQRAPIHPPPASGLDRIVSTRRPGARSRGRGGGRKSRRAIDHRRPNAQGRRIGRSDRRFPPGDSAVHRQTDFTVAELCRPGRHRHRKRAAAQ